METSETKLNKSGPFHTVHLRFLSQRNKVRIKREQKKKEGSRQGRKDKIRTNTFHLILKFSAKFQLQIVPKKLKFTFCKLPAIIYILNCKVN